MKEFIDKLIERLEEEHKLAVEDAERYEKGNSNHFKYAKARGYATAMEVANEIVNQLAEEYKVSEMPTGWISVSERLPEAGKRYLVSVVWKDEFNNHIRYAVYDAVYGKDGLWHTYDYEPVVYEVIAWQPLPPAWKGENNGKA